MKLIEKIKRLFKKSQPVEMPIEPVVIKTTEVPTNLYKGRVYIKKEDFISVPGDEIEKYVRKSLVRQIEEVLEKNIPINVQEDFYGYIYTTDIFIGFERR